MPRGTAFTDIEKGKIIGGKLLAKFDVVLRLSKIF